MAQFFILRPVLAWVISIFIVIAGLIALPQMPIAQYPQVAPPQIQISTFYTGASPNEMYQSVAQPIEEELNGIQGIQYFESTSDVSGAISITSARSIGWVSAAPTVTPLPRPMIAACSTNKTSPPSCANTGITVAACVDSP